MSISEQYVFIKASNVLSIVCISVFIQLALTQFIWYCFVRNIFIFLFFVQFFIYCKYSFIDCILYLFTTFTTLLISTAIYQCFPSSLLSSRLLISLEVKLIFYFLNKAYAG